MGGHEQVERVERVGAGTPLAAVLEEVLAAVAVHVPPGPWRVPVVVSAAGRVITEDDAAWQVDGDAVVRLAMLDARTGEVTCYRRGAVLSCRVIDTTTTP